MNIILRDALYTEMLNRTYQLDRAEPFFEIPLDGIVRDALRVRAPGFRRSKFES